MKNQSGCLKKLIDSGNLTEFQESLELHKFKETLNRLNDLLDTIINQIENQSFNLYEEGYKVLDYLEQLILGRKDEDIDIKRILEQKHEIIERIKAVKKENRISDKKIVFLREVINRLENIEINLAYNIKSEEILENYNIIKYIILTEKNINYSKNLIEKYSYLINAYNMIYDDYNLFDLIIDEYLKELYVYAVKKKSINLYYYDDVLEELLNNSKIKIDSIVKERNIEKIMNSFSKQSLEKCERERASSWYKHLIKLVDTNSSAISIDELNSMYNVRTHFKSSATEEAEILKYANKNKMVCRNLSDYIITIDADSLSVDKDDALSIKKQDDYYELKIFIADPNTFCGPNSLLLEEASQRGQTLYLEDKNIYMFPEELITSSLSLDENRNRFARAYIYKIDEKGEVIDFKIEKQKIRVSNNLSYDKVNEILRKGTENQRLEESINYLRELKSLITKKYIDEDLIEKLSKEEKTTSEKLIEAYMVFNNHIVAKYFHQKKLLFIYRNHKLTKSLEDFKDQLGTMSNYEKILKGIEKISLSASYSLDKPQHEGLNLDYYSHTTSPLRRFADVLVNLCEDKFYFTNIGDQEYYKLEEYLKKEVEALNEKNQEILEFYKRYTRTLKK